jgi:broad specificity phosphatase PhoE
MKTTFYLVRHGQTRANYEDRLRGWVDVPLDETGLRQAELTGKALREAGIEKIYSSRLGRALETGRAIGRVAGAEVVVHEGFMDFHFGAWGGLLREEVKERWPDLYRVYDGDPASFAAPEGERLWDVKARVESGLSDLLSKHPGGTVAITSHSVTCKILLLHLLGLGPEKYWNVAQANCCINVFHYGERGWVVEKVNETCHLT